MNPIISLTLLLTVILGTFIVLLRSNWFSIWLGLEINTLAFLPILVSTHHPRATEATTKYFLIQALASAIFLISGMIQGCVLWTWSTNYFVLLIPNILILLVVALKMGIAPCHFWLPDVLQGLPLQVGLILSTWQKIAPFSILLVLPSQPIFLFFGVGVISAIIGGWGGLNQTHTRKLLAYSSIAHLGWIITAYPLSPQLRTLSLSIYIIMTRAVFIAFSILGAYNLADLGNAINFAPWLTILSVFVILSLGGLPPLTGFLIKWFVLQELASNASLIISTILIFASLISLFFYLRVSYILLLTLSPQHSITSITWRSAQYATLANPPLAIIIATRVLGLILPTAWLPIFF